MRAGEMSGSECWVFAPASRLAIACVASLREPSVVPIAVASAHQPKQT